VVGAEVLIDMRDIVRCALLPVLFAVLLAVLQGRAAARAEGFPRLEEHVSRDGVLAVTLVAAPREVAFDGVRFPGMVYNGRYEGPLLRVKPGDLLRVHLVNQLAAPTNLHFHGIATTPRGRGDNVAILVPPGATFDYEVPIPPEQPPGLFWYHAHVHGLSEAQVMGGLSGALVVEGAQTRAPQLAGLRERVLVLKDVVIEDSDDPLIEDELHGIIQSINGRRHVELTMTPGETQIWRIGNQSANLQFHLRLAGHRFRIIAEDGGLRGFEDVQEVLHLRHGARLEVLVEAAGPGDFDIVSERVLTGDRRERVLGRLHVAGPVQSEAPPAPVAVGSPDLRRHAKTGRRTVRFTQERDESRFYIDGRVFDHARTDVTVRHGSVEEWTIRNDTDDVHTFHIHQLHFQVIAINARPTDFTGHVDTVRIPERGSVTLILPFTGRLAVGRFVFHCHVLKHEDRGMMASIEVTDASMASALDGLWRRADLLWRQASLAVFALRNGMPLSWCGL
jgi:FtsP/CotA-like multicopper oxidase with cupredoxin domain